MDWYTPKQVSQYDGSKCQGSNCWGAAGAWAVDGATRGEKTPSAQEFRHAAGGGSGKANAATGCHSGLPADMDAGLEAYGVPHSWRRNVPVAEAALALADPDRRRLFLVETDYELWPATKKCRAPSFDGNHAVGIIPGTVNGMLTVANPVCDAYQKVGLKAVLASMEKFARDHGQEPGTVRYLRVPRRLAIPVDPCAEEVAELRAQLADTEEELQDVIGALKAIIRRLQTA